MNKKKFNVIIWDINKKSPITYDVLPYFRREWQDNPYNLDTNLSEHPVKTWEELKTWIKAKSQYEFWGRCQYEFLIASWPFGSKQLKDSLIEFLRNNPNLNNYEDSLKLYNIIIKDMNKIDIHEQIMHNIDIITDILYEEFLK